MPSVARNHHFLPQCYLRGFARGQGKKAQVFVTDLEGRKTFSSVTKGIGSRRDFNRVDLEGYDQNFLEQITAGFEGDVATALRSIETGASFEDRKVRGTILAFIALLIVRNPRFRGQMKDAIEQVLRRMAKLSVATPETWKNVVEDASKARGIMDSDPPSFEEMKAFVDGDEYTVNLSQTWQSGMELKSLNPVLQLLHRRRWVLYTADATAGDFITCDHPACLYWTDPKVAAAGMPPGLVMPETQLLFPLSRRRCLVGSFDGVDANITANFFAVCAANSAVVRFAQRQIYSFDDSFFFRPSDDDLPTLGAELLAHIPAKV